MNGKEFYQWLANKRIKLAENVIFTIGDGMDQQLRSFLRGTGKPFLSKPFTPEEITDAIRKNLQMDRKGRAVATNNRSSFYSTELQWSNLLHNSFCMGRGSSRIGMNHNLAR